MMDFEGKTVLVTGAGRGIGRAIAESFAANGALVAANDLTPINLDQTLRRISQQGGIAREYLADVAKKMPVQAMVSQVLDDWSRIDILVNCAGVDPHASLLDLDAWDWQRTLEVNLSGPFFTIQTVGRVMREQGGGVIVNIAASAGRAHGAEDRTAFVASKMGLIGLTRQAARELAAYNIRVNAVCPGVIETHRTADLHKDQDNVDKWLQEIPQNRLGTPGDVIGLVLFLCSDAARYITGQAINVDGGNVMS
jgi:NAD(P)-dependent dehydrogenase (short-subunit alcohol dehydrogenase family)